MTPTRTPNPSQYARRKPGGSTWLPFSGDCLKCGTTFRFYARLSEHGNPMGRLFYCSKRCQGEAAGESRRKVPPAVLRDLYEKKRMPVTRIAARLQCSRQQIYRWIKKAEIPPRGLIVTMRERRQARVIEDAGGRK